MQVYVRVQAMCTLHCRCSRNGPLCGPTGLIFVKWSSTCSRHIPLPPFASLSHTHTHTLTHFFLLRISLFLSLSPFLSLPLSCSLAYLRARARARALSLSACMSRYMQEKSTTRKLLPWQRRRRRVHVCMSFCCRRVAASALL